MKPFNQWKKSNKWIFSIVLSLVLFSSGVLVYYIYKINQTLTTVYQPVVREKSEVSEQVAYKDTKTYLLLATDERLNDKGRTDGIVLLIVNDKTNTMTMLSIPRDTYVQIANTKKKSKMNSAYKYGISSTIATVENFTGVHIDHYLWFNMEGFVKAIDAVDGILLNIDPSVAKLESLPEGLHEINGKQALEYTRFRSDKYGVFGRSERQKEVLKAFLDRSVKIRSPLKINEMLEILGDDLRTDLKKDEIYDIAKQLDKFSSIDVEEIQYKVNTGAIKETVYVFISEAERLRVSNLLKQEIAAENNKK